MRATLLNGLSIANAAASHSYDLNRRRCAVRRSPARPCRQRQKMYENPQSSSVAAAQPHAST